LTRSASGLNGPSQVLVASDEPIIDQIAASEASRSELRDIVAANPGAKQKPSTTIAPSHAIWIRRGIFLSYVLIISPNKLKELAADRGSNCAGAPKRNVRPALVIVPNTACRVAPPVQEMNPPDTESELEKPQARP
jgi:hypothetical protein